MNTQTGWKVLDRFCPEQVFTPYKGEDRCLCGFPRAAHVLEDDGRGGFRSIEDVT